MDAGSREDLTETIWMYMDAVTKERINRRYIATL